MFRVSIKKVHEQVYVRTQRQRRGASVSSVLRLIVAANNSLQSRTLIAPHKYDAWFENYT